MTRYSIVFLIMMALTHNCIGQVYHPVQSESSVKFSIKNFGLLVTGSLSGLEGNISFDPANPGKASFLVNVSATTINTGIDGRDEHLRKKSYFDVQTFPKIIILSKQVTASAKSGEYVFTGTVKIKGVSKDISFPFTAISQSSGGILFSGGFKLNRRDFGVGGSSLVLSDNLTVSLSVLANQ